MKNISLLLGLLLLCTVVLSSCGGDDPLCSTCVVKDTAGDVVKNYDQKCGTSTDVENYEASAREDASQLTGTITCTR
jgi:hypothetical protein